MNRDKGDSTGDGVATSKPEEMSGVQQNVRGVGFEPTKAYATGFPRSPVIPRDRLSLAPFDFEVARSCPLDLVPAWLVVFLAFFLSQRVAYVLYDEL